MAKRRTRRKRGQVLAERALREIKAKKTAFLREVSTILTDTLGFSVKVSLSQKKEPTTPAMRAAARRPAAENRRQMAELMQQPDALAIPKHLERRPAKLDDAMPF